MSLDRKLTFSLATINSTRVALIRQVHVYCEAQVELWRKVPWLALQANGRNGYSDRYSHTVRNGMWCVGETQSYYSHFVDCATGKLVGGNLEKLSNGEVLQLANRMDELDAQTVIDRLKERASMERPDFCTITEWERAKLWRDEQIKELGLTETYVRTRPPQWSWNAD